MGRDTPISTQALAVESGRVGTDAGRLLGQRLTAPPPAGAGSNSYKRRDRLRLLGGGGGGGNPGTVAKFPPNLTAPNRGARPAQREEHAPRAARGSARAHQPTVPGGGGRARRAGRGGAARGAGAGQPGKVVSCAGPALFPRVGENGIKVR